MEHNVLEKIRRLLEEARVLSLAVVVDGDPEAALLPFARRADYGALYVQASGLARHARGLQPGARVGVLVHANDSPDADPMQLSRPWLFSTRRAGSSNLRAGGSQRVFPARP